MAPGRELAASAYSVIASLVGLICPIRLPLASVNHRLPFGPRVRLATPELFDSPEISVIDAVTAASAPGARTSPTRPRPASRARTRAYRRNSRWGELTGGNR